VKPVIFHPSASAEFDAAVEYYERRAAIEETSSDLGSKLTA
jgi:hypothetical protein